MMVMLMVVGCHGALDGMVDRCREELWRTGGLSSECEHHVLPQRVLAGKSVVVVGDSLGELYFLGLVAKARGARELGERVRPHASRVVDGAEGGKLAFVYAPYAEDVEREVMHLLAVPQAESPDLVLVSTGLHDLLYNPVLGKDRGLEERLGKMVATMDEAYRGAKHAGLGPRNILWPLYPPLVDKNLQGNRQESDLFCDAVLERLNAVTAASISSAASIQQSPDGLVSVDLRTFVLEKLEDIKCGEDVHEGTGLKCLVDEIPDGLHPSEELMQVIAGLLADVAWLLFSNAHTVKAVAPAKHYVFQPSGFLEAGHVVVFVYLWAALILWIVLEVRSVLTILSHGSDPFVQLCPSWAVRLLLSEEQATLRLLADVKEAKVEPPPAPVPDVEAGGGAEVVPVVDVAGAKESIVEWICGEGGLAFARKCAILAFVLLYMDAADGDPVDKLWPSIGRQYSGDLFWFLNLALAGASLLTIRSALNEKRPAEDGHGVVLNREQTEEWKGWMQVAFVLYHYYVAKETYNMIRVFIAAYVWMTGFGNFSYFYIRKDFSMIRLAKMMFRLNFLVTMVCLAVQRQYMLYYVCALHTFAFLQVYVTMYIMHAHNQDPKVMIGKLCFLFAFNFVLFDIPGVHEAVFAPLYGLLGYNGSMHEWHFRSHLDHYMVVFGMATAYVHPYVSRYLVALGRVGSPLVRNGIKSALAAVCLAALYWYASSKLFAIDKYTYNAQHPYISWIPVLAFMVIRNLFTCLRDRYLHLFAWLGRITLETYILQFHVWLSHDAKNVTLYILDHPLLNFVLATLIYLYLSWLVFKVTVFLSDALVPRKAEPLAVAKRIGVVFFAFAVPWVSLLLL